jgi:serine/threonine protein kinase
MDNQIKHLEEFNSVEKFKPIISKIKESTMINFKIILKLLGIVINKKRNIIIKTKNTEKIFRLVQDNIFQKSLILKDIVFKNINNKGEKIHGSYAQIFLANKKNSNIILKIISPFYEEYRGLIFNYLLQNYYINSPYLCIIHEFGSIQIDKNNENLKKYYGIMDNCGKNLEHIFGLFHKYLTIANNKHSKQARAIVDVSLILNIITIIFIKCLQALKLIHDINYLHLDIKPDNFLFSGSFSQASNLRHNGDNIIIKIIDFGTVLKENTPTTELFGTNKYLANDYIKNCLSKKETILRRHHDIFSLGCTFIMIIYYLLNGILQINFKSKKSIIPIMICPTENIILLTQIDMYNKRAAYSFDGNPNHPENPMKEINELFTVLINLDKRKSQEDKEKELNKLQKISRIICKMCNSIPEKRYKSVNEILNPKNPLD